MEVYLIRHTKVAVPAGIAYGQTDVSPASSFVEEAALVQSRLNGLHFDAVWSSPLTRCRRLAAYCGYSDCAVDDRLKEIHFGDWEMKSWDEIAADSRSKAWFDDWIQVRMPDGESFLDQYERLSAFLDSLKQTSYQRVALFTHGGILTCANVYAGNYAMKDAFEKLPPYGSVLKIEL